MQDILVGGGARPSVQHVMRLAGEVLKRPIPVDHGPRRAGDPAVLVADARRARTHLGWRPRRTDPAQIIGDAAKWEARRAAAARPSVPAGAAAC